MVVIDHKFADTTVMHFCSIGRTIGPRKIPRIMTDPLLGFSARETHERSGERALERAFNPFTNYPSERVM